MNDAAPAVSVAPAAPAVERPIVLCVDDEPNVLASLAPHLRRRYQMLAATGGAAALEQLQAHPETAVVISDMRMPAMDGASFLAKAREVAPEATRLLLTGHAEINAAIAAINEGRIFRFLTKPCAPVELMAAVEAAVEQHRLVTAERVLLEQTLHGAVKALTEVLGLTNPLAFGRAARVKQLAGELARWLGVRDRWQIELAAMLSQLGAVILPNETAERLYHGQPLSAEDREAAARAAAVTQQLLENIPRLELVRGMLARAGGRQTVAQIPLVSQRSLVDLGSALLVAALDYDAQEARGATPAQALEALRSDAERYRPEVLEALAAVRGAGSAAESVRELPLSAVTLGMVFAEDVKLATGALLVPRGYEVTPSLLERIRGFRPNAVKGRVRVVGHVPHA